MCYLGFWFINLLKEMLQKESLSLKFKSLLEKEWSNFHIEVFLLTSNSFQNHKNIVYLKKE